MVILRDLIVYLESFAPLKLQESYDNSGLLTGSRNVRIQNVLISLDVTEAVLDEALENNCNVIVAHHPFLFSPIKSLTGQHWVERILIKAIQQNIAIYVMHTNLDNVEQGVSFMMAGKLGMTGCRVLRTKAGELKKLITFCPADKAQQVRDALFSAGGGNIGNYSECSFSTEGTGTYRGNEKSNPFAGQKGELHHEREERIEVVFPAHIQNAILTSLMMSHPYEEVAYDVLRLENHWSKAGSGIIGKLEQEMPEKQFLNLLKKTFNASGIRYTDLLQKPVMKIALCGGAGSFLLNDAIDNQADVFVTADFKYHQFFDADQKILIADIGHYESEQFTKELIYNLITKKFTNFAAHLSKVKTNPINYLT